MVSGWVVLLNSWVVVLYWWLSSVGVLEGLQYAWRLGFRNVEIRIDSQVVVNMLVGSTL